MTCSYYWQRAQLHGVLAEEYLPHKCVLFWSKIPIGSHFELSEAVI